jgi:hypothetical protein
MKKQTSKNTKKIVPKAPARRTKTTFTLPRALNYVRPIERYGSTTVTKSRSISLSRCALKYAAALNDPFGEAARGACVPYPAPDTMRVTVPIRTDITIGTGGVAVVFMCPSLANDAYSLIYTTSAFAGTMASAAIPWATLGTAALAGTFNTGWSSLAVTNLPFNTSTLCDNNLASNVQGRIVSAAMRTYYTGKATDESGLVYTYHDANHTSVSALGNPSNFSPATAVLGGIANYPDTVICNNSRDPCLTVAYATDPTEMVLSSSQFKTNTVSADALPTIYPFSNGTSLWNSTGGTSYNTAFGFASTAGNSVPVGSPIAVAIITGVVGSTVHLEYIIHAEYTGPSVNFGLTRVHSDPVAADQVRLATMAVPAQTMATPTRDRWKIFYDLLNAGYDAIKPMIVPTVTTMLKSMLL